MKDLQDMSTSLVSNYTGDVSHQNSHHIGIEAQKFITGNELKAQV